MRYELRAFYISFNQTYLCGENFCGYSDSELKDLMQQLTLNTTSYNFKKFSEHMTKNTVTHFINETVDDSPARTSLGMEYIYEEAGPYATEFTFTNILNFACYYVTIRACYGSHANPDCSNPTLILTQTAIKQDADEVANITVKSAGLQFEHTWDPPENPNGQILFFHVKVNGTDESARCIPYKEYLRNGGKFNITDSPTDLLSVSMRSVGSNWYLKPAEVKVNLNIETSQDAWKIYLLILVLGIVIVVVLIVSYLLWKKRKINQLKQTISPIEVVYVKPYEPDDNHEVARESVELSNEIGRGDFGKVFEGTLRTADGGIQSVAVKTINESATLEESTNFLEEASIMKNFDTFHIVQLLGIVSETQPYLVIMELMANGDLKTFLRKNRPVSCVDVTSTNYTTFKFHRIIPPLSQMAIQIADGMAFMEQKKIIHRDLAARNCMVDAEYTVKIGDFGLARHLHKLDYYRRGKETLLPVRWMAPECLSDGIFSSQSDVFSYGIVLWEIVTYGEKPYKELSNAQVVNFVINGRTEKKPNENCPENIFELMQRCWKTNRFERISFIEIIKSLLSEAPESFREHSFYRPHL